MACISNRRRATTASIVGPTCPNLDEPAASHEQPGYCADFDEGLFGSCSYKGVLDEALLGLPVVLVGGLRISMAFSTRSLLRVGIEFHSRGGLPDIIDGSRLRVGDESLAVR